MIKGIQWGARVEMGLNRESEAPVSKRPLQVTDIVGKREFIMEMVSKRGNINRIYSTRRKGEVAVAGLKNNLISNRDGDEGTVMVD